MAQRQFLDTDTDKWRPRYGNAGGGDVSETTRTETPIDSTFTGTAAATTGVATNASFAAGQIVWIDQTQGTNADTNPSWELNKIASYTAGAPVFVYPLTRTYTSGAQIVVGTQMHDYNLNGATLTAKLYTSGSTGGLVFRIGTGRFYGTGTIDIAGRGFQGGTGQGANGVGARGAGHPAGISQTTSGNGNGAGGGPNNNGAGAGGGNGTAGTGGTQSATAGTTAGNAALTIFSMGGGGSSGSNQSGNGLSGDAGEGGGKLLVIFPRIDISSMTIALAGLNGATSTGSDGSPGPGGGGAGGSALFKGQSMIFGTNKITAPGGSGTSGGGNTSGNGGVGRIHADISNSANLSGTTNPTTDVSVQKVVGNISGASSLFLLL